MEGETLRRCEVEKRPGNWLATQGLSEKGYEAGMLINGLKA
jgi:hypothetical protein